MISTIKPECVEKADIELSAKYDPAKHKMFIDAETGKPTGVVNCDRFKDFPVDWPGLVAIPVSTLPKIANQKVRVIAVHGCYGKGDAENPYMELGTHKIIKVKLEDGRVPFQRLIAKLNRRTHEE